MLQLYRAQALVARTTPLFLTLFTNLFSIKFLYFFIISSLFLILICSCQYSYNLMLTSNCMRRPYIDTNNPQGMKLPQYRNLYAWNLLLTWSSVNCITVWWKSTANAFKAGKFFGIYYRQIRCICVKKLQNVHDSLL